MNEGIQNDLNTNVYPRIVIWEYDWEDIVGSDTRYDTNVTYQVSFFSDIPRHPKLIELKRNLNEKGIFSSISHEYVQESKYFHSFFKVEVREEIG